MSSFRTSLVNAYLRFQQEWFRKRVSLPVIVFYKIEGTKGPIQRDFRFVGCLHLISLPRLAQDEKEILHVISSLKECSHRIGNAMVIFSLSSSGFP